ncbi:MAG TPA: pitrilysin family protein [Pyrinomonadaceae bacterium]|nr:pitrilysin family protein [Pyrinomonadaceae bacterium]
MKTKTGFEPRAVNVLRWILSFTFTALLILATGAHDAALVAGQEAANPAATQEAAKPAATPPVQRVDSGNLEAQRRAAALVTEFDVNGLKVLVKQRPGSLTVAGGLFIRGGSRNITAENAGVESLMLDVATEASANFPRERLRDELARMGTVIGASENYDYSVLSVTSTRAHFDRSWQIFVDIALRPAFTKEDFDLVRDRKVASLRDDTDDPDSYLQRLQERVAYAGHPYLNRPEGTAESVSRLTLENIRAYYQQMMQTSRLLFVIVGDLDVADLRQRITAAFGKLPRGDYRPAPVPELAFTSPSVEVIQRGLPTNYVQGLFTAPQLTSADIYPMSVASNLLRDRVFEEVRVRRNLSYAPNAFLSSQGANVGGIYVTAVDANQAVAVMLDQIKRLQTKPATEEDITGVVSQFLTSYYLGQETNAAQAANLAEYELIGGGWRNSFEMLSKLSSVTPEEVQRVAQKYMRNIRFVVLGDPKSIDKNIFTNQAGG